MAFELRHKVDVMKGMKNKQVKEAVAMLMIGDWRFRRASSRAACSAMEDRSTESATGRGRLG